MDLPGFKKDEIKIECNKGNLVISAEKCEKDDEEEMNVIIFVVKEFIINTQKFLFRRCSRGGD